MRITPEGQITIPQALREKYGLDPQSEVEFIDTGDGVVLRKVEPAIEPFELWIKQVRGITKGKMTTDQIMHLTRGEEE